MNKIKLDLPKLTAYENIVWSCLTDEEKCPLLNNLSEGLALLHLIKRADLFIHYRAGHISYDRFKVLCSIYPKLICEFEYKNQMFIVGKDGSL